MTPSVPVNETSSRSTGSVPVRETTSRRTQAPPAGPETQKVPGPAPTTVGELVSKVSDQLSRLVRGELQLAQIQLAEKGKRLGVGAGFFAVAALAALYALGVLLAAAVLGLAVVLPAWLSALIIGVVLLIIAGIAALLGKKKVDASKAFQPKPQEGLKEDVDAVKKGIQQ